MKWSTKQHYYVTSQQIAVKYRFSDYGPPKRSSADLRAWSIMGTMEEWLNLLWI